MLSNTSVHKILYNTRVREAATLFENLTNFGEVYFKYLGYIECFSKFCNNKLFS